MICPHCKKDGISYVKSWLTGQVRILTCPSCGGKSKIEADKRDKSKRIISASTHIALIGLIYIFIGYKAALAIGMMMPFVTIYSLSKSTLVSAEDSRKVGKVRKYATIAFFWLMLIIDTFILISVLRPDISPVDDSALSVVLPNVTDEQNGFLILSPALDSSKNQACKSTVKKIQNPREPSAKDIEALNRDCAGFVSLTAKAISYPYLFVPDFTGKDAAESIKNYEAYSSKHDYLFMTKIAVTEQISAWWDLKNGDKNAAMNKLNSVLKLGKVLQDAKSSSDMFLIGQSIKRGALHELNAMIDEKQIPPEMRSLIIKNLDHHRESPQQLRNALAANYQWMKTHIINGDLLDAGESDKNAMQIAFKQNVTIKRVFNSFNENTKNAGKTFAHMKFIGTDDYMQGHSSAFLIFRSFVNGNMIGDMIFNPYASKYDAMHFFCISLYSDVLIDTLRVKLAVLEYYDGNGRLPERLNDLVPAYIASVPVDPFDGQPMRYDPKRAIIYSVGRNIKDDGGKAPGRMFIDKYDVIYAGNDFVLDIFPQNRSNAKQGIFR